MTTREQLEAVARAAGIEFNDKRSPTGSIALYRAADGWWNPLIDDGDALRLAVALNISHFRRGAAMHAQAYYRDDISADVIKVCEEIGNDQMAAVRRAIFRAAVELAAVRAAEKP